MQRRDLLTRGAKGAAALALGPLATAACASTAPHATTAADLHPAIAALAKREPPPPITAAEQAERRERAQRLMTEQNVDAMFIESGPSLLYFAGVEWGRSERTFGMLLPRKGDAVLISPSFEEQRAGVASGGRFAIRTWHEYESPFALIASTVRDMGAATGTVAIDESARFFIPRGIAAAAPSLTVADAAPITHPLRGVKSAHEIAIMRFANRVTVEAFEAAFRTLHAGITQQELAKTVSAAMTRLGYSGGALVLFGESSAYPHGSERPRPLGEGEVVLVDGGLSVHGYASDITRTVAFGTPSAEARHVYDVVYRAQSAALAAAAPGRKCGDVDTAARKVVEDAGFGPADRLFTHRLGHGIGLEGHEWPYLVHGSEIVLQPGMTFSDEPGIYQYGKFGVRIEDVIAITESGAEMLTERASSTLT
ncbi:MAG TPA: Xaa-Pro peptidase family protein [Gemmatimonadaceae bacterium]|nr:Xaa-Pro peptidase family protein [Gemmatimonadaceae bacterium]